MDIFVKAIVLVLSSYLTFTNNLADFISTNILPDQNLEEVDEAETTIRLLPSIFSGSIPGILLESREYQQAALGAAEGLSGSTTDDPMAALVNIFCTFTTKNFVRTTTGTGFFIDPDGVIMTNAHIAQFLLLEKTDSFGDAKCTVRTGSPATPRYTAELLYIPPAWVQENAALVEDSAPMGTGERDYALLYVANDVNNGPLPAEFPSLPFNDELVSTTIRDNEVTAAGYPATDLIENGPSTALLGKIAITSISELYTFGSNYADVISIRGSEVGAEGASGGPIINEDGEVIGMIATKGDDETDGEGSLRAITLSHVNRTIKEETGFTLDQNLNGDLPFRAKIFNDTMTPFLVQLFEDAKE
jgi:hypothetical protein